MEKLNLAEMSEIAGGKVCTKAEYCATLDMLLDHAGGDIDLICNIASAQIKHHC